VTVERDASQSQPVEAQCLNVLEPLQCQAQLAAGFPDSCLPQELGSPSPTMRNERSVIFSTQFLTFHNN
jgi:hypothetical protein